MAIPYRVQNPTTNEIVESFDFITVDELDNAVATAHKAFGTWSVASLEDRAAVLHKVCLLYTSPSPRDVEESRMPSSA